MDNISRTIAANLREMRKARGMSQGDVAGLLGKSQSRVSAFEKGESIPDIETIIRFCDIYSTDANSLLSGEYIGGELNTVAGNQLRGVSGVDTLFIPLVQARLSAGRGSFETGAESERHYGFRSDFLRRKGNVSEMVLMRVDGDSMEPEIKPGDMVLIDQSQRSLRPGQIYAVGVEDMVYLKLANAAPGKLILSSTNAAYPPLEVDTRGDLESAVHIIGRCVWSCREL